MSFNDRVSSMLDSVSGWFGFVTPPRTENENKVDDDECNDPLHKEFLLDQQQIAEENDKILESLKETRKDSSRRT